MLWPPGRERDSPPARVPIPAPHVVGACAFIPSPEESKPSLRFAIALSTLAPATEGGLGATLVAVTNVVRRVPDVASTRGAFPSSPDLLFWRPPQRKGVPQCS